MAAGKVLVAEDNDFVRMQIVKYLVDEGCEIIEAMDGKQAMDAIGTDEVDLAIVDVRMEPVDGFEFIRRIRSREIETPVILVTGDNNADLLEQAGKLDVGAVLIKPVQKDRLVKTVMRTLEVNRKKNG